MNQTIIKVLADAKWRMEKVAETAKTHILYLPFGKPIVQTITLSNIEVKAYGGTLKITDTCTIQSVNARTAYLHVWDKVLVPNLKRALNESGLGLTIETEGAIIKATLSPINDHHRTDFIKFVKKQIASYIEKIYNVHESTRRYIEGLSSEGVDDGEIITGVADLQSLTNSYIDKLNKFAEHQEKEIMALKTN